VYIRHVIDQAVLIREMSEGDRAALAAAATLRRYRSGEFLWRVGDPEDSLLIVAEGMVHIGMTGPDAEEVVLHVVARGGCMGEPSIYSRDGNRRTDGRAVGRTTIVEVPGEAVRGVLEANPTAMRVFVRRVSEIARAHAERVALTMFHDARGRLARLLLDLADSHGIPTPRGRRIELPLSQRTLAGLVSVRRERVNRLIADFERNGVLEFEDGIVTVLEEQRLRSALGADAILPRHG
jgi:CRP/FNR family transcriptional regulator, cyclic AMP receptor protein